MELLLFERAADVLTRLLSAVLILLIGAIIARALGRVFTAFLNEIEFNATVFEYTHFALNLEDHVGSIVSYVVYVVTLFLAFDALGITTVAIYVMLGVLTFFFALSLLVGVRDLFPNLYAGLTLMQGKKFKEEEKIQYEGKRVLVKQIGFLEVKLETKEGDILFVSNAEMVRNKHVVNLSRKKKKKKAKK